MSPDITRNDPVFSPEEKESTRSMLDAPRGGVTRYNRKVVIAIVAALASILAIAMIIAFGFDNKKAAVEAKDETAIQIPNPDLTALPTGYSDPRAQRPNLRPDAAGPGAPGTAGLPPAGTDPSAAPGTAGTPGAPGAPPPPPTPAQQRAEAARTAAVARRNAAIREEMAARSGPIIVAEGRSAKQSDTGPELAAAEGAGAAPTPPAAAPPASDTEPGRQNLQTQKTEFIQTARVGQDYLSASLQPPRSAYEIKAGTIIPAALVTALNSDLPGDVIATVTENVYDHVTGHYVLIPQGTRLFGQYDSKVAYKQSRALVVWNRIIYPNGTSINIGGMIGADATGAAGLSDQVNNHVAGLIKGIVLSTAIAAGGALADNTGTQRNQLVTAGGGALSQEASRTGQRFVERELDRQPTITIRPGARLRVIVNRDMVLAPY